MGDFKKDLEDLLKKKSDEDNCDIPDFLLAERTAFTAIKLIETKLRNFEVNNNPKEQNDR